MSFNFDYIGNVDVSLIKDKLLTTENSIWLEDITRQNVFSEHKHTETINLIWDTDSLNTNSIGNISSHFYNFNINELFKLLKPIYYKHYGEGEFVRALLVKLKKNYEVSPHKDSYYSLSISKRTHIPIITNPNSIFNVNDELKHLKEGEIWEINNQKMHSVQKSNYDRIHLILDYYTKSTPNII
jgi:aspartyl/asparaginyl beta-hydroxylase (cupin superfamily)